jgi:hypothetical protein
MMWCHKGDCATLRGKISKKYLKSLKKHEIKRKFICFTYKIEIYFIREHQLLYFHSWLRHSWKYCIWCSLSEIIFQSYMKTNKYPLYNFCIGLRYIVLKQNHCWDSFILRWPCKPAPLCLFPSINLNKVLFYKQTISAIRLIACYLFSFKMW